jgi:hypothetical protein
VTGRYRGRHHGPAGGARRLAAGSVLLVGAVAAGSIAWAVTRGESPPPPAAAPSRPSPSPSSSPSPTPSPLRSVTIAAVGDTMLGHTPILPPDPATYLDGVKGALRASIVFGNLEGTLTDVSGSKCPTAKPSPTRTPSGSPRHSPSPSPSPSQLCYAFRVPPSYAGDLRAAGFTVLNNANNHSYDFGAAGQQQTVDALGAAHIAHTGLPGQITVVRARGIRVAFIGFAPYGFTASLLDLPEARALIRAAGRRANVVVVYMHAGAEGSGAVHVTGAEEHFAGEDRGNPRAFAHAAVDAGADLVIASGPHVLRGMEFYRRRLIAYSLGNFAGYHNFSAGGNLSLSAILRVTLAKDGSFVGARLVSLRLSAEGRPGLDPSHSALGLVASLSRADFGRHAARFASSGAIRPPGS